MGVINWEDRATYKDEILQVGSFGGVDVCSVVFRADQWPLLLFHSFPGGQGRVWDAPVPCFSQSDAQRIADDALEEFLREIGFVSKSELDEATANYSVLYADFSARVDQALDLAKDLRWSQSEVDRLKRVLKKIRREIDRESNRDIYCRVMKIVNDAHIWATDPVPKQRTEADFLNAEIDDHGYVTFRDGGTA